MNRKIGKRLVAATLVLVTLVALGQPAHAQQITPRADRASYVPGDTGTLFVSIVNTAGSGTIELRNITIYFPWAQLVDGKWPTSGANVTVNLSPWVTLGSQGSNNNIYLYSTSFTIPSWYSGGSTLGCPGRDGPRYGTYSNCILVGETGNPPRYNVLDGGITIQMALPTYTPVSFATLWLPIATLVVLVVATAFLALAWTSLRRMTKK